MSSPKPTPSRDDHSLPTELTPYIHALSEPISIYTRYMDALLISRASHSAFFHDLKSFRLQPPVLALLTTPSSPTFNSKEMFLTVTRSFLASRFAHPWCRTTPLQEGWSKAQWGSTKKQSEAKQREEMRLHKLLVPIWCGFRVRMMPSEEVLVKWVEEDRRKEIERRHLSAKTRIESRAGGMEGDEKVGVEESLTTACSKQDLDAKPVRSPSVGTEAYCMELEDDDLPVSASKGDHEDAAAAAKLFVGVAATGYLVNNPRVRKYLFKKLNKKA